MANRPIKAEALANTYPFLIIIVTVNSAKTAVAIPAKDFSRSVIDAPKTSH